MDNKLEFIKNLKELFKEYNIFDCFNTPELMADELSENLQIIIDDYKKKEAIASDDIQEIVKETIENIVKEQINNNKYAFSQFSYMTQRIVKGPILLEGETSPDRRITRLKNVYEIYRDNIANEQLIVLRFADDIVITIIINPKYPRQIRYYKNNEVKSIKDLELFKINYLKLLENEPSILNNELLIKELVKNPILEEGVIACNGRIIRNDDHKEEMYFDRKTKENITVTRMGNQVLIEYKENGIKKFDRLFINGVELTIDEYMDLVIQNNIHNIFPEHYNNITEEGFCNTELIEWLQDGPLLDIGCQTYQGRIYRAITKEEKYIDLITSETIRVTRMGNQVIIEYKDNGIKKFDKLFINEAEITIDEYMDLVIQYGIPNIFPEHYKNITEEGFCNTELIERLKDRPLLDIGCQTYQGRIYRAKAQEEKYIDLITSETLRVIRNKKDNDNYVTIIKNEKEKTEYINYGEKGSYQKVIQ